MITNEKNLEQGEFVTELIRGLIYTHNRANANTTEVHQSTADIQALVEILVERGVLNRETLEKRRQEAAQRLRRQYIERGMAVAMQEFNVSKYEFKGGVEIDCENRVHLCKAACCRLPLALSKEDVKEGAVRWDLGQPYMLARNKDGYCNHLNRATHQCTVYANRPIPCRGYDCRKDKRIWSDFENKIANPRINDSDWPECLETETKPAAATQE
ncbi:MAG: YkgJ family cysteine cluster protein [Dehalococcoidia bacterium]